MTARRKGIRRRRRTAKSQPPTATPPPVPRITPRRLASVVGLGVALVLFAASTWLFVLYPAEHGPGAGHSVEVTIPQSPSAGELGALLAGAGLVSSPRLFAFWVRMSGGSHGVVEGRHFLTDDASPRELMARLERHPRRGFAHVTFPEGWTRFDMARRLQEKRVVSLRDFLDATTDEAVLREL